MGVPTFTCDEFLNLEATEVGLAKHFERSTRDHSLRIDLSNSEWISILSVCTLFSWGKLILEAGGQVSVIPPTKSDSYAARFLESSEVMIAFEKIGAEIGSRRHLGQELSAGRLAAFKHFRAPTEAERYIQAVGDPPRAQLLLHSQNLPEIVNSGDFSRTILRELVDNAFTHGSSNDCHYSAIQVEAAPGSRRSHPIFSDLGGGSYVEMCVADTSAQNLVDTLMPFLPQGYRPAGRGGRDLSTEARCAFFAFEYESTSQPQRRRERILKLLRSEWTQIDSIATGLYDVAALARFYGGQVVFRVANLVGTIDHSSGNRQPRLVTRRRMAHRRLAPLPGTLILLRVPTHAMGSERVVASHGRLPSIREGIGSIAFHVLPAERYERQQDDVDSALRIEREVLDALKQPVAREVSVGEKKQEIVALLLDGIDLSTKAFGALLLLLARAPRHRQGLLVVVDDPVRVRLAAEQWGRIEGDEREATFWTRFPTLVVAAGGQDGVSVFGSLEHPDATTCSAEVLSFPGTGLELDLAEVVQEVRRIGLAAYLSSEPIRHEDSLYLIESAYYTPIFFEVRKVLDDLRGRRILMHWLSNQIARAAPSSILVNTEFLLGALKEMKDSGLLAEGIPVNRTDTSSPLKLALQVSSKPWARVVVLLDVVCTARFLNEFLRLVPSPQLAVVVALVDCRADEADFLPVVRDEGTIDVPVVSLYRRPVQVLHDRPEEIDIREVFVVDPMTHSPTKYPLPERGELDTATLLRGAAERGGLSVGHFLLNTKHYIYFLGFRPALRGIRAQLTTFLQEGAQELIAAAGIDARNVQTLCLDEGTGLYEVLSESLADGELKPPRKVEKRELMAPPVREQKDADAVWFVLPAMATGNTLRRVLEYGRALGATRLHVDIVIGRIENDRLLFYQKLRQYGNLRIRIRFLCIFPLLAYREDMCPACALLASFDKLLMNMGHRWPELRKLVRDAIAELAPIPASSAAQVDLDGLSRSHSDGWKEALAREEFESADRDPAARSRLMKRLGTQEAVEALASAAGREPTARVFSHDRARRIAYEPALILRACEEWCRREAHEPLRFERQLRGFAQLVPDTLREEAPLLFLLHVGNRRLLETLLVEAARKPDVYFDAVQQAPDPEDARLRTILYELRDYLRRGGSGEKAAALFALHELRWHLVRSTAWGMPLEVLRMKASIELENPDAVRAAYRRFIRDGYNEAERRLYVVKSTGTLWSRLNENLGENGPSAEEQWGEVQSAVAQIEETVEQEQIVYNDIIVAIGRLEAAVRRFVQMVDEIAIRPGSAMKAVKALANSSERTRAPFEVVVDAACPSLAITQDDFEEFMLLILENAAQRSRDTGASTFSFQPVRDTPQVLIGVAQDGEWTMGRTLEGGLARVRELLEPYGGTLSLKADEVSPGESFLEARVFSWPMG